MVSYGTIAIPKPAITTFDERGAETPVIMHDLSPSKEALDGAIGRMAAVVPR